MEKKINKIEVLITDDLIAALVSGDEKTMEDAERIVFNAVPYCETRKNVVFAFIDNRVICHTEFGEEYYDIDELISICRNLFSQLYGSCKVHFSDDKLDFIHTNHENFVTVHLQTTIYESTLTNFMLYLVELLIKKTRVE